MDGMHARRLRTLGQSRVYVTVRRESSPGLCSGTFTKGMIKGIAEDRLKLTGISNNYKV